MTKKQLQSWLLRQFLKRKLGLRIFRRMLWDNFELTMRTLKRSPPARQTIIPPEKIEGFEDLYWLFLNTVMSENIILMALDEAAYIFKVVRENKPLNLIETGTSEGGSTMVISTAKPKESHLISLDIKDLCNETVKKLLDPNTALIIQDSKTFMPSFKIDFIFIDGDHSFQGVKADLEHFLPYLNPGADILFHDAAKSRKYAWIEPTVVAFAETLWGRQDLKFIKDMGSIRHFKKV